MLEFTTGPNESLGEKIQASVPKSHVVKAFNSVGAAKMVNPHYEQGTPTMFLCGNNSGAKGQVSKILDQFGWEPFDCGGIIAAARDRAALHALVHPRLPAQPVDSCVQSSDTLVSPAAVRRV